MSGEDYRVDELRNYKASRRKVKRGESADYIMRVSHQETHLTRARFLEEIDPRRSRRYRRFPSGKRDGRPGNLQDHGRGEDLDPVRMDEATYCPAPTHGERGERDGSGGSSRSSQGRATVDPVSLRHGFLIE